MQFFYIDYINDNKKERNIGFLKAEDDGLSIGLRGIPLQCGDSCTVYVITRSKVRFLMGEIHIQNGNGSRKLPWTSEVGFKDCAKIIIPLYGNRYGQCIIRDMDTDVPDTEVSGYMEILKDDEKLQDNKKTLSDSQEKTAVDICCKEDKTSILSKAINNTEIKTKSDIKNEEKLLPVSNAFGENRDSDIGNEINNLVHYKWQQLMKDFTQVHIYPEAQAILIKPKDMIVLTQEYHGLAVNSFLLHSYYNYRQLLLLRYPYGTDNIKKEADIRAAALKDTQQVEYYVGVAGVYNERERRLAELFGFEGFESGESRMNEESKRQIYAGCFGYYMKRVEI